MKMATRGPAPGVGGMPGGGGAPATYAQASPTTARAEARGSLLVVGVARGHLQPQAAEDEVLAPEPWGRGAQIKSASKREGFAPRRALPRHAPPRRSAPARDEHAAHVARDAAVDDGEHAAAGEVRRDVLLRGGGRYGVSVATERMPPGARPGVMGAWGQSTAPGRSCSGPARTTGRAVRGGVLAGYCHAGYPDSPVGGVWRHGDAKKTAR
jgi:hypothetical protein